MKLSEYAQKLGVGYKTAWNYFKDNRIEGAYKAANGCIMVPDDIFIKEARAVILYIRVDNSNLVPEKIKRLTDWSITKGYKIIDTVIEYGDHWTNYNKFEAIFFKNKWDLIVVEDMDEIFPAGHNILRIIAYNKIESINKLNIHVNSTPGQDIIAVVKNLCKFSGFPENLAIEKTNTIVKLIMEEINKP